MTPVLWLMLAVTAPGSGRVALTTDGCSAGFEVDLRPVLAIELKTKITHSADPDDTRIELSCDGDQISYQLAAPKRAPVPSQTVDTRSLPQNALARAIALLLAEAVTELWSSPETHDVLPPPPPLAVKTATHRLGISAFGSATLGSQVLFGAGLAITTRLSGPLGLRLAGMWSTHTVSRVEGDVRKQLFDGDLTVDLRLERTHALLRAGLGARVGLGQLTGTPTENFTGGTVQGAMWGPLLSLSAEWLPIGWFGIALGADGGIWVPTLEGKVYQGASVTLQGPFATIWLGVVVHAW